MTTMVVDEQQQQRPCVAAESTNNQTYGSTLLYPADDSMESDNDSKENRLLNLLQISQFLTTYQSFYSTAADNNLVGPILREDLEHVLHYRSLKRKLQHWKDQATVYDAFHHHDDHADDRQEENPFLEKINEFLEKLAVYQQPKSAVAAAAAATQQQNQDAYNRIVKIDKLWRRMQIWTCKALAQHLLVAHDNIPKKTEAEGAAAAAAAAGTFSSPRNSISLQRDLWSYPLSLPLSSYSLAFLPLVKNVRQTRRDELLPFAKIFDETYNSTDESSSNGNSMILPTCLLVPPNHYNHHEYSRICIMMTQLPNDKAMQAVHLSPLALNARKLQTVCSSTFKWHTTDLVALWIRAQRSPQALRHLIQLFNVTPVLVDDNNNNDNQQQLVSRRHDHEQYRAEFRGNHKLVYKRSILCSNLADKICTWAIANQLLCTYPQFVKYWQHQQQHQASSDRQHHHQNDRHNNDKESISVQKHKRKRPRGQGAAIGGNNQTTNKRRRKSPVDAVFPASNIHQHELTRLQDVDAAQTTELHRDCQAFILRTWARRHAKALQLLYQHPWQMVQQQQQQQTMSPLRSPLLVVSMDTLKAHLKLHLPKTTDHNLLRIERRIGIGKYDTEKAVSLQKTVTNLVQAFRHCLIKESERRWQSRNNDESGVDDEDEELNATVGRLQEAQDDLEDTCRKFETVWNEAGAVAAARSLFAWTNEAFMTINASSAITTAIPAGTTERAILSSAPAPWLNICCKCNAAVKEEGSYRICACCQQVCHISCCDDANEDKANQWSQQKGLKSYISSFPPLLELFLVKPPSTKRKPDFHLPNYCGDRASEITWTTTRVQLKRTCKPTLDAADTAAAAGPSGPRRQLEPWGLSFFETRLGKERMDDLLEGNLPLWKWKKTWGPPLAIPHVGLIVSKIFDSSPSARSAVQVGDVIVAVRIGESDASATTGYDEKFCPRKMHTLAHLESTEQCGLLFQQAATELDLVIQRPSRPILEEANTCLNDLVQAMEIPQAVLDDTKSGLLHFCPSCRREPTATAKRSTRDTLRNCQAVIRRLGSEWYGPCFWFENHVRVEHVLSLDVDGDNEDASVQDRDKLDEVHAQSVSLGRLDHMMKELFDREEDRHAMDEDASVAFFVGNHRLKWAADLEKSPLTILCRGISLLLNDYKQSPDFQDMSGQTLRPTMEMRKALAADFVRFFACWSLVISPETHISLKGPYPHALFAGDPVALMRRCCSSCRVRQLPSADGDVGATRSICDVCQSLADITTSTSDDEHRHLPRVDVQIQRYQERARLVGCSVLLLPGDPLLEVTANALSADNIMIENCDRPFEFIVVSYLPSNLKECGTEEDAGVFHLLPIVNQLQMKYLLQRCKFRQTDQNGLMDETIHKWKKDGLLDLLGVLQLPFRELTAKINATARIVDSVTSEVARQARCTCDQTMAFLEQCFEEVPHHDNENDVENVTPCSNPACCACAETYLEGSFPWQHETLCDAISTSLLIDAGLQAGSPVMTAMVQQELGIDTTSSDNVENEEGSDIPGPKRISGSVLPWLPRDSGKQFRSYPPISIQSELSLVYTDLYFDSHAELLRFETSPSGELLIQNPRKVNKMAVVLLKQTLPSGVACDSSFGNGWGWGFELILQKPQRIIRVGRIHHDGPAFASGLRSGDILVAINGKHMGLGISFCDLVCAILSVPHAMIPIRKQQGESLRSMLHWISAQQRPLGPVILDVLRASPFCREADTSQPQASRRPLAISQCQQSIQVDRSQTIGRQQILASRPTRSADQRRPQPPQQPQHQPLHINNSRIVNEQSYRGPAIRQATVPNRAAPLQVPPPNALAMRHPHGNVGSVATLPKPVCYSDLLPWIAVACQNLKVWLTHSTNFLSGDDLYVPYRGGVLTIAETSVLMTAVASEQPMLGVRLLSPRYPLHTILKCLELFSTRVDSAAFRTLPPGLWDYLLQQDYVRSEQEDQAAPAMFIDPAFRYRMPTKRFPIDRLCEDFMARVQASAVSPNNSAVLMGPDRIRGGGPTKGSARHVSRKYKFLIDLPQCEWDNVQVMGKCKGAPGSTTTLKFTGHVKFPAGSSWSADMKVSVSVFRIETKGEIPPYILQCNPRKLKVVHDSSNDAPQARKAENPESHAERTTFEPEHGEGQLQPSVFGNDSLDKREIRVEQAHPLLKQQSKMFHESLTTQQPENVERAPSEKQAKAAENTVKTGLIEGEMYLPETKTAMAAEYAEHAAHVKPAAPAAQFTVAKDAEKSVANEKPAAVNGQSAPEVRGVSENETLQLTPRKKEDANELLGLRDSQKVSTIPLGFLPDGRPLYWFRSDPHAVFFAPLSPMIQDDSVSELALTQATLKYEKCVRKNFEQHQGALLSLRPSQPGTYSCLWGCAVFSEDGVGSCRSFASMSELRDHIRTHHSYIQEAVIPVANLVRVDDPSLITGLCCGLAAAACAKCSPLNIFTQTSFNEEERVVFSGDRLFSKQRWKQVVECMASQGESESTTMGLYSRLARLFQIADEETHGLAKDEVLNASASYDNSCDEQKEAGTRVEDPGCCRLGCERVLVTESEDYRDTGCLPIGDICLNEADAYLTECGDISIGDAKSMLLALASSIPESILKLKSTKASVENIAIKQLSPEMQPWSDGGFDSWKLCVLGSQDARSLGQAFVTLVFSLPIDLPEWWESEGIGWSPLLASHSISSLLHHLQVFEAALMEFVARTSLPFKDTIQHIPEDLISFPYDKQVSITLDRAKEIGLDRFKGEYKSFCAICQDGGDLICCELCSNVGHTSCYKLTDANVNDFICYACMTDVATMHSKAGPRKRNS